MKKTVIDELIEKLEALSISMKGNNIHNVTVRAVYYNAINEAEQLKEAHKQEIIGAWEKGYESASELKENRNVFGIQYYKETYLD